MGAGLAGRPSESGSESINDEWELDADGDTEPDTDESGRTWSLRLRLGVLVLVLGPMGACVVAGRMLRIEYEYRPSG